MTVALHLKVIASATVFKCIEDVQTVILVELEGLADVLNTRIFTLLLLASWLILVRRVMEELRLQVLVVQDSIVQGLVLGHWLRGEELAFEGLDLGCESRDGLSARELLDERVFTAGRIELLIVETT